MEKGLYERDLVGLQDFVLLEDYQSEDAFIDNLKKRFQENLIYVSYIHKIWYLIIKILIIFLIIRHTLDKY